MNLNPKICHLSVTLALLAGAAQAQSTIEERLVALEARPQEGLSFGPKLELYGYVKADLIYDLDSDLGTTIFGLSSLAPGGETGEQFRAQAIQSRLGVRYSDTTDAGDLMINLEGDFFGNGGGGFRLRHAYGQLGGLLAGRTWTNFMPIESYPGTLDFQGPAGIPFSRQTQLRYTYDVGTGLKASFSIENAAFVSEDPVLTAAVSYSGDNYFVKAAALGGRLETASGSEDVFGFNLSGNAQLWEGGSIQASFTQGEGIASYMVFGGNNTFGGELVESTGATLGVTHAISDQLSVGLAVGYRENDIGALDDTETLQTAHLTVSYSPVDNVSYGIEYITGERETFANNTVSADRIQASFQYNF